MVQALLPSPVGERGDVSPRSGERGVRGRRGIAQDVGNYNARIKQAFLTGRAWGYTAPSPALKMRRLIGSVRKLLGCEAEKNPHFHPVGSTVRRSS